MGNKTWWDIMVVKSLYTTHFVPMHSGRKKRRAFLVDCLESRRLAHHRRASSSAGRRTGTCHLECEAAGVILRDTAR